MVEPVSQYFVGSRNLTGFKLTETDGGYAIDQYARLFDVLAKRCGGNVAGLFAEPHISYGNGKAPARVDWYTRYDGIAKPLHELDQGSALSVRKVLATRLAALRSLSFDPEYGPLVASALNIADPGAVISVGGEPVLIDWGMLPQTALASERQRIQHFQLTLGSALVDFGLPPLSQAEWSRTFGAAQDGQMSKATVVEQSVDDRPAANDIKGPAVVVASAQRRGPGLVAPTVAVTLAASFLAFLFGPGVLSFSQDGEPASAAAMTIANGVISGLENQRRKLDEILSQRDCEPIKRANADGSVLPPPLERVTVSPPPSSPAAPGGEPVPPPAFIARAAEGSVIVLAAGGSGSGFFVAPDLVVTNHHVVTEERTVHVANSVIGVIEAEVISRGSDRDHDFALLKVAPQPKAKPFEVAVLPSVLQPVVAVGFPGVAMGTDPAYQRLMQGDETAARKLIPVMSSGPVNHLQPRSGGVTFVVHGADISHGNSGGPLIDLCGRVVGINTFGRSDNNVVWRYALGSDGIKAFVERAGTPLGTAAGPCVPTVVASAETPAASAPNSGNQTAPPSSASSSSPTAQPVRSTPSAPQPPATR